MTVIAIPKEQQAGENRAPLSPSVVKKLVRLGATVQLEAGVGDNCGYSDQDYQDAGAAITNDRSTLLQQADITLRIQKPTIEEVNLLKSGSIHISFLDPFNEQSLVNAFREKNITALSMEMIP